MDTHSFAATRWLTFKKIHPGGVIDMHLRGLLAIVATISLPNVIRSEDTLTQPLIHSISKDTLWQNRDGKSRTWFHPRVCMMPDTDGKPIALMNLQEIGGSD